MTLRATLVCFAIAFFTPGTLWSQPVPDPGLAEQSLEELMSIKIGSVTSASRHEQPVTEAPSSVTVVTAQDIATFGWRTLGEALRSVRGFYTTYDRNYTSLGARGFGRPTDYNNRVLVLVDGHRLNDNIYDGVGLGSDFPLDIALVERIEVIRGPGSALYGTSAFFAVINVITRRGSELNGVEGSVESASFNTWRTRATYGIGDAQGRDLLLSVGRLGSRGIEALRFPEYDEPGRVGISRGADGDSATSMLASAHLGRWTFQGAAVERTKHLPTGAWDTVLSDAGTYTVDTRAWANATWRGPMFGGEATVRTSYDHMTYRGSYVGEDWESTDGAIGDWIGGEATWARRVATAHRLTGGVEHRDHLRQRQTASEEDLEFKDERRSRQTGLYAQDEITLLPTVTAIVGGRVDWWSLDGWTAHPRLGLIVQPGTDTSVKLLYGQAYRAANVYERFYGLVGSLANPTLRPETLRTTEAVIEKYVGGRLRLTASAYMTHIDDLVSQSENDGQLVHINTSNVKSRGIEAEAERRWTNGVVASGSMVWQRSQDAQTRMALTNSPARMGTLAVQAPLGTRRLTMALDGQYVGTRGTERGATADPFWLTNLTWRYAPPGLRATFAASIYNAGNVRYAHPVGLEFRQDVIEQDGRVFSVRATFGFGR